MGNHRKMFYGETHKLYIMLKPHNQDVATPTIYMFTHIHKRTTHSKPQQSHPPTCTHPPIKQPYETLHIHQLTKPRSGDLKSTQSQGGYLMYIPHFNVHTYGHTTTRHPLYTRCPQCHHPLPQTLQALYMSWNPHIAMIDFRPPPFKKLLINTIH